MKKTAAFFLAVLMVLIMAAPMSVSAVVVSLENGLAFNPGNTRNPNPEYNFAWLDQLFVRTDATALVPAALTPTPTENPYSHTYEEFVEECDRYITLYSLDEKTVDSIYSALIEMVYYSVVSTGMTDNFDQMCTVLSRNGIQLPDEATTEDKMKIAIVYAALEFNAMYTLYDKQTELPAGITLDAALTIILGELTGVSVPSGVNTTAGLGIQAIKQYLSDYNYIPLSDNPSTEELFYFLKVAVITENEENVPLKKYSKVTADDKEYVDYTYFATILNNAYETEINPDALYYASQSESDLAVHRLVLGTMLEGKGVSSPETASVEKLFDLACKNGCFPLEQEFYSDILSYSLEVAPSCEKIWFTPITLGNQLNGGNKTPLTLYLQGKEIAPGSTTSAALDTSKKEETIFLEVVYSDSSRQENALYEFRIIKNDNLETSAVDPTDILGQVQNAVNAVVPSDNETASEILGGVFNEIGNAVSQTNSAGLYEDILSTYENEISSFLAPNQAEDEKIYNYLDELLEGIYETDANGNVITTKTYTVTTEKAENEEGSFLQQVTQTVTENPEIVVAPTSLIALGGLVGFMMNKKHKDSLTLEVEEETETETE